MVEKTRKHKVEELHIIFIQFISRIPICRAVRIYGTILKTTNAGVSSAEENIDETQTGYIFSQNYPNPFNPSTKISWQSPVGSWQTLKVYDILGNEVATLVNEYRDAGNYEIEFPPVETHRDASLPSGVYFYQLKAGDYVETKKMILLK
jgi:hypothetical protein